MNRPLIKVFFVLVSLLLLFNSWSVSAAEAQRTIIDQSGRSVAIPAQVRRVIVPFPWALNMVCAVGGRDLVVGVSTYARKDMGFNALFPEWLKTMPLVGDLKELNKEMVLELKPDLVIHTPGSIVEQMESINVPVVTLTGKTTVPEKIRFIGQVVNRSRQAQELALYYDNMIRLVQSKT
ncbi:MAG: ABC transporter substrate-binding protein, partial [Chlorobiales bacterium]|nr:ABC transporter substrate-binding protein [Chlorobiales bacterium]